MAYTNIDCFLTFGQLEHRRERIPFLIHNHAFFCAPIQEVLRHSNRWFIKASGKTDILQGWGASEPAIVKGAVNVGECRKDSCFQLTGIGCILRACRRCG